MKIILDKTKDTIWERGAPFLVEGSVGSIVLVTDVGDESRTFSGVLLSAKGSDYILGEVRDNWAKSKFSLYIGKVVMEN